MCKPCNKKYNQINKEHIKQYNKCRYENNKVEILEKIKKYHLDNKENIQKYNKQWFQDNKDKINKYSRYKYKNDVIFKLKLILRNILKNKLKSQGGRKYKSSIKLTGCTIEELKYHLEGKFLPEMTWSNHGSVWEIDHIVGCVNFNLEEIEQQNKCFHYTNLQPLFKTTDIADSFGYTNQIGNRNKSKKI
jgi:hypothetical protein